MFCHTQCSSLTALTARFCKTKKQNIFFGYLANRNLQTTTKSQIISLIFTIIFWKLKNNCHLWVSCRRLYKKKRHPYFGKNKGKNLIIFYPYQRIVAISKIIESRCYHQQNYRIIQRTKGLGTDKFRPEIQKLEILCSNCHSY